jgi:hypothetical protein
LLGLWRELHRRDPMQLQLAFKNAAKHRHTQDSAEEASVPATLLPFPCRICNVLRPQSDRSWNRGVGAAISVCNSGREG